MSHPEEPIRRRRRPFFTLQQIEELKQQQQQHEDTQDVQNTLVSVLEIFFLVSLFLASRVVSYLFAFLFYFN